MLDLHCHILPGVDDGATDLDEAVAMARALVAVGFRGVAASPHAGGPGGDTPPARAAVARRSLEERLRAEKVPLAVLPNAEHQIHAELFERITAGQVVPIGGSGHWLLVEMPWTGLADPEGVLFRLQAKGLRLLLAHPERHPFLDVQLLRRLVERGVKMQLELASFVGMLGEEAQTRAEWLMGERLGHVLATDLHSPLQAELWIRAAMTRVRDLYGDVAFDAGLRQNPNAMLTDTAPTSIVPMGER